MKKWLLSICLLLLISDVAFAENSLYSKAIDAYRRGDFKKAVETLKDYLSERPDPKAYYLLGYASYKLKQHKEASEYFRQAYLIDPDFNPESVKSEIRSAKGRPSK